MYTACDYNICNDIEYRLDFQASSIVISYYITTALEYTAAMSKVEVILSI